MHRRRWRRRRSVLLVLVAVIAAGLGIVAHATGLFHRTELQTIDARFQIRGSQPALVKNFVVVGIDKPTFSYFHDQRHLATNWPFPRRYHARVIDNLLKRPAPSEIAFDIQFTEPTDPTDDYDLFERARARRPRGACHRPPSVPTAPPECSAATRTSAVRSARSAGNATVIPDTDGVLPANAVFGTRASRRSASRSRRERAAGRSSRQRCSAARTRTRPDRLRRTRPARSRSSRTGSVYLGHFPAVDGPRQDRDHRRHRVDPAGRARHPTSGSEANGNLMAGPEIDANEAATAPRGDPAS